MKLLTTRDLAKRYGVETITAIKWCERKLFPNAHKHGRDWAVPESDLLKFKLPKRGKPPQGDNRDH